MTMKLLASGVAAAAAVGAAAAVVTSVASGVTSTSPVALPVQPVALGAPLPLDPPPPPAPPAPNPPAPAPPGAPAALPTDGDLSSLLTNLTNPGVSYKNKTGLVENGISDNEGHDADHQLRDAYRDGKFPLSFDVSNIQPAGPNAATADVAITGPKLAAPATQHLAFVDQGGWKLQHDSALALMQAISAS